jgi:hypothetical protein
MTGPFERIVAAGPAEGTDAAYDAVKAAFPEAMCFTDEYAYWHTKVIQLTATRFVMLHDYYENVHDMIIVEGAFDGSSCVVDRFYRKDQKRDHEPCMRVSAYMAGPGINWIPFQFLHSVMVPEVEDFTTITFTDAADAADTPFDTELFACHVLELGELLHEDQANLYDEAKAIADQEAAEAAEAAEDEQEAERD